MISTRLFLENRSDTEDILLVHGVYMHGVPVYKTKNAKFALVHLQTRFAPSRIHLDTVV